MKKIINMFVILLLLTILTSKAFALSYEEALNESYKKPMVLLIYAEWAENYQKYLNASQKLEESLGNEYNFVRLNIASEDTKLFNQNHHIYPNLPYVLLFKEGGKVSRYIQRDCAGDETCMEPKIKMFKF